MQAPAVAVAVAAVRRQDSLAGELCEHAADGHLALLFIALFPAFRLVARRIGWSLERSRP